MRLTEREEASVSDVEDCARMRSPGYPFIPVLVTMADGAE
jgi:hypothetical protein